MAVTDKLLPLGKKKKKWEKPIQVVGYGIPWKRLTSLLQPHSPSRSTERSQVWAFHFCKPGFQVPQCCDATAHGGHQSLPEQEFTSSGSCSSRSSLFAVQRNWEAAWAPSTTHQTASKNSTDSFIYFFLEKNPFCCRRAVKGSFRCWDTTLLPAQIVLFSLTVAFLSSHRQALTRSSLLGSL